MLLKKSPKKWCGIETRNDRILQVDPLSQYCLSGADLESIFLKEPAKILFQQHRSDSVSLRLGKTLRSASKSGPPLGLIIKRGRDGYRVASTSRRAACGRKASCLSKEDILEEIAPHTLQASRKNCRSPTLVAFCLRADCSRLPAAGLERRVEAHHTRQIFRGLIVQAMLASASFLLPASWREEMEPLAATQRRQGSVAAGLLNFRGGLE
jgi:hypothetical protein